MAFIVAWCGIVSAAGRYFIGVVAYAHLEHYRVDSASGKIWRFSCFQSLLAIVFAGIVSLYSLIHIEPRYLLSASAGILSAIPVLAKITGMLARRAYGQPAAYQGEKVAENAKGSPERFGYSWARFSS